MSETGFKTTLARVKEDFLARSVTLKRSQLTVEEVAQLLYKYLTTEPLLLKDTLLRSTGRQRLAWDDLLQFLQQELSVVQAVKKNEYSPLSATEVVERNSGEFGKMVSYVKSKETNTIQSIQQLPIEMGGCRVVAVCLEKELIFYDITQNIIISSLSFRYTQVRAKLLEKQQQRRVQKMHNSVKIDIDMQASEQVVDIVNLLQNHRQQKTPSLTASQHHPPLHFLTSNIKNSVRGSQLSSEKSNEKMMFRRTNTQSGERRKPKSNMTRVKNDDVQRVFHFFQHSSLQNSIRIAHAFVDARTHFHKYVSLDNSLLQQPPRQRNFELSSAKFHQPNYNRDLDAMRKTNRHLTRVKAAISREKGQEEGREGREVETMKGEVVKRREEQGMDPLQMNGKQLGVLSLCFLQQFMLVSLFNRQIRLFRLKKALNRITEQLIFQRPFKEVVTFAELYRSKNKQAYRIVVAMEREGRTQIQVLHLDNNMQIKEKAFELQLEYSAKCQSILPLGVALFDELGHFSMMELNSSLEAVEEKLAVSTQLFDPLTGYRISLTQARINTQLTSLFLGCGSGTVFLYDRYTKTLKYQARLCASPVLDLVLFRSDHELLVLYSNGNMAVLSTSHLEKVFLFQAYAEVPADARLFISSDDHFYVYWGRSVLPYALMDNQEKQFSNLRPAKILKSRLKLKEREKSGREKSKVLRVVEGRGGEQDFLGILLEGGQILVFDCHMQYIGSYFYFRVMHIAALFSNAAHQFLALLLDNNTIEVVNLYTQALLFTARPPEDPVRPTRPNSPFRNRPDSSLRSSSFMRSSITRAPRAIGVNLVSFMDETISNCFLSVISRAGRVNHFNEKGIVVSTVNLEERLGDLPQGAMLYEEEELVIASEGSLVVLYRKSYNRRCVVKVSAVPLIHLRKAPPSSPFSLCVMDVNHALFFVNIHLKQVKCVYEGIRLNPQQHLLFSEVIILRVGEQRGSAIRLGAGQVDFKPNHEKYVYSMIGQIVVQVNRANGRIQKLKMTEGNFEDYLY